MATVPSRTSSSAPPGFPGILAAALDDVEKAFGPRSGRIAPVDGCRQCCFSPADLDRLSGPVDRVDDDSLFRAVFKWGGALDRSVEWLRWVTPRLLRGMVERTHDLDDEMIACRLDSAGWTDWPDAERLSVESLCSALWQATLDGAVSGWTAASALTFLVTLTGDIGPWLETWAATPGRAADLALRDLWLEWGSDILAGELRVAVYQVGPNIAPALGAFLLDQTSHRLVEGDLDEVSAWSLAQLPLPVEERWR